MERQPVSLDVLLFHTIALSLKEALRGIRHVLRATRDRIACALSALPGRFKPMGSAAVRRFDRLAYRVDRRSSDIAHRYFDPQITPDANTAALAKLIGRDDAAILFAKVAYDSLKTATGYVGEALDQRDNFFISEMLGALAFRRAETGFGDAQNDRERAALLLVSMYRTGIVRTAATVNATRSTKRSVERTARISCFAVILWLSVEKSFAPEDEAALLFACCDLAIAIGDEIVSAGDDADALEALLGRTIGLV